MQLLDGNACSEEIRKEIKIEVEAIISTGERPPHLPRRPLLQAGRHLRRRAQRRPGARRRLAAAAA